MAEQALPCPAAGGRWGLPPPRRGPPLSGAWRAKARRPCSRASSSAPSPSSTSAPTRTRWVPGAPPPGGAGGDGTRGGHRGTPGLSRSRQEGALPPAAGPPGPRCRGGPHGHPGPHRVLCWNTVLQRIPSLLRWRLLSVLTNAGKLRIFFF